MYPRNETTEATDQYGRQAEPRHEGPDSPPGPDAEGTTPTATGSGADPAYHGGPHADGESHSGEDPDRLAESGYRAEPLATGSSGATRVDPENLPPAEAGAVGTGPVYAAPPDAVTGERADVDGADVDRTDVDRADVYPADVGHADVDRSDVDRSDVDRSDVDRSDVDRYDVDRSDVDRSDVDRADVDRADVYPTDVGRAGVDRADVDRADVDRADVDHADVDRADVDRADVDRADVDRADVDRPYVDRPYVVDRPEVESDGYPADDARHAADTPAAEAAAPGYAGPGPDAAVVGAGVDEAHSPSSAQTAAPPATALPTRADDYGEDQLLPGDQGEELRRRWRDVQAGFVDDPRDSVRRAGELVGEAVQTVTVRLAEHWQAIGPDHGDAATEELRRALRRYRALFDRLLDL
jgi:hypothetical protein